MGINDLNAFHELLVFVVGKDGRGNQASRYQVGRRCRYLGTTPACSDGVPVANIGVEWAIAIIEFFNERIVVHGNGDGSDGRGHPVR